MKIPLLAVFFSLVILGLLAFAGLRLREPPAAAMPQDAAAWSRIDKRLEYLERSLGRLTDLEKEVARLSAPVAPQLPVDAGPPAGQAAETAAAEAMPGDADVAKAPSKFERWLETNDMREDMEGFVARVYEQTRNARINREREEAEARQREMQELSEGPYGKHNYRMNLLTKRLGLDGRQTEYLFNLLSQHDERVSGLKRELAPPEGVKLTAEQLEQHLQHLAQTNKALKDGLESDFFSRLSAEQQKLYEDLPEEDRVAGSAVEKMVFIKRAVDVMAPPALKLEAAPAAVPVPTAGR